MKTTWTRSRYAEENEYMNTHRGLSLWCLRFICLYVYRVCVWEWVFWLSLHVQFALKIYYRFHIIVYVFCRPKNEKKTITIICIVWNKTTTYIQRLHETRFFLKENERDGQLGISKYIKINPHDIVYNTFLKVRTIHVHTTNCTKPNLKQKYCPQFDLWISLRALFGETKFIKMFNEVQSSDHW